MSAEVIRIDPDRAERLLGKNVRNRHVRRSTVEKYARDMANGDWVFNGDTIRLDTDGNLLDGQHRLLAVIQSGATIPFLVVDGLPTNSQETMDLGVSRRMADQLLLRGEQNVPTMAAILRRVRAYDQGNRSLAGSSYQPTHAEMFEFLAKEPAIRRAVDVAVHARKRIRAPFAVIGSCYHICSRIDTVDADRFFVDQLIDGLGLTPTSPALVLRRRLESMFEQVGRVASEDQVRYIFTAWNAYRDGRDISKLQAPRGGWTSANYPTPR